MKRPMPRYRDAKDLNKQQFIVALFRCSEAYGFRPSVRTMEALLGDVYGVRLRRATLLRILADFLERARDGYHPEAEAGNGFASSGKRNGVLGNTSPISGNGFASSGKHSGKNGKQPSDLSSSRTEYSLRLSHANSETLALASHAHAREALNPEDPEKAAERAERLRVAREMLAAIERTGQATVKQIAAQRAAQAPTPAQADVEGGPQA